MSKVSRRFTIGTLIIAILGAVFMTFLYFHPYDSVTYTKIDYVRTDYRLANDEIAILDDYEEYDNFIQKTDNVFPKYNSDFFKDKVLIVSIREGILFSQSRIQKVTVKDDQITILYRFENDMVVNDEIESEVDVYYISLIEFKKSSIDTTKNYKVSYVDKVM